MRHASRKDLVADLRRGPVLALFTRLRHFVGADCRAHPCGGNRRPGRGGWHRGVSQTRIREQRRYKNSVLPVAAAFSGGLPRRRTQTTFSVYHPSRRDQICINILHNRYVSYGVSMESIHTLHVWHPRPGTRTQTTFLVCGSDEGGHNSIHILQTQYERHVLDMKSIHILHVWHPGRGAPNIHTGTQNSMNGMI